MTLEGKVVLITGASSGIGRAASLAFDKAGARVSMAARRRDQLVANAAEMTNAFIAMTDMTNMASVEAMVDRTVRHYGRLDILINNAATSLLASVDDLKPEDFRRVLDVNFTSAVVATTRALRTMRRQHSGVVINIGSPGGFLGVPYYAAFAASKAALHGWTRTLQAEWAGTEIFVCEYQPGVIDTELARAAVREDSAVGAAELLNPAGAPIAPMELVSPESVAEDLLRCAQNPTLTGYSSPYVRFGAVTAYVDWIRRRMLVDIARDTRKRLGRK